MKLREPRRAQNRGWTADLIIEGDGRPLEQNEVRANISQKSYLPVIVVVHFSLAQNKPPQMHGFRCRLGFHPMHDEVA